jgi:hypothetical protein
MLLGQDRRQLREVFFRAWARHRQALPLEGVEATIVAVARRHPEYHALLDDPVRFEDRDYSPEAGQTNPFLHMGMHIAIEEQLALDQPGGIRSHYRQLLARFPDEHAAQHRIMECLGEWLWRAGRDGAPAPESAYLDCIARSAGQRSAD